MVLYKNQENTYIIYLNVKVKGNLSHNELVEVKITSIDYPNVIGEI